MPVATSPDDKRLAKSTGNYDSREELTEACKAYRLAGLSHTQISELVGVAACTISRILNGDKKTYVKTPEPAPLSMAKQGNIGRLDALWSPPQIPLEIYDELEHRLGQPARMW